MASAMEVLLAVALASASATAPDEATTPSPLEAPVPATPADATTPAATTPATPVPAPAPSAVPPVIPQRGAPRSYGEAYAWAIGGVAIADVLGWGGMWLSDAADEVDPESFFTGLAITIGGPGYFAAEAADDALQRESRAGAWPAHLANAVAGVVALALGEDRGLSGGQTLLVLGSLQLLLIPPVALLWSATSPPAPPDVAEDDDDFAAVIRTSRSTALPVRDPALPLWRR